ncbi:hypothetical protein TNCV_1363211, partial [Trichonephila clavipes]
GPVLGRDSKGSKDLRRDCAGGSYYFRLHHWTTQSTSRIITVTFTLADLLKTHGRTPHSLQSDAEIRLVLSWLGVQTVLLNIGIKYDMTARYIYPVNP